MTFDSALEELFEDTVTIAPFSGETAARARTYGAAVTYKALIERGARKLTGPNGEVVVSNVQVTIPDRVAIGQRDLVTLPSGFIPQQPPIVGVEPLKGLGLDHTRVLL